MAFPLSSGSGRPVPVAGAAVFRLRREQGRAVCGSPYTPRIAGLARTSCGLRDARSRALRPAGMPGAVPSAPPSPPPLPGGCGKGPYFVRISFPSSVYHHILYVRPSGKCKISCNNSVTSLFFPPRRVFPWDTGPSLSPAAFHPSLFICSKPSTGLPYSSPWGKASCARSAGSVR